MYPYFRCLEILARARFRPLLQIEDESVLRMRVWPGDLDFYPEMNNGRHLSLMDLGRLDFAARTGLLSLVRQRGWGLVVGGASIRYRRRLPPWRRFRLRTRLLGHDGRWFYFDQRTERQEETCSAALIRAGIRNRDGLVPAHEVLQALGVKSWTHELPDWVAAWVRADGLRPWPESEATV